MATTACRSGRPGIAQALLRQPSFQRRRLNQPRHLCKAADQPSSSIPLSGQYEASRKATELIARLLEAPSAADEAMALLQDGLLTESFFETAAAYLALVSHRELCPSICL